MEYFRTGVPQVHGGPDRLRAFALCVGAPESVTDLRMGVAPVTVGRSVSSGTTWRQQGVWVRSPFGLGWTNVHRHSAYAHHSRRKTKSAPQTRLHLPSDRANTCWHTDAHSLCCPDCGAARGYGLSGQVDPHVLPVSGQIFGLCCVQIRLRGCLCLWSVFCFSYDFMVYCAECVVLDVTTAPHHRRRGFLCAQKGCHYGHWEVKGLPAPSLPSGLPLLRHLTPSFLVAGSSRQGDGGDGRYSRVPFCTLLSGCRAA